MTQHKSTPSAQENVGGSALASDQSSDDGAWQAEMVTQFLSGNEYAFTQIVDRYGSLLLRTAYLLVRDEEAAKDIVQDSFILAWKNASKLRERQHLRAWLLRIVVNQATSIKRQLIRRTALFREHFVPPTVEQSGEVAVTQTTSIDDSLDMAQAISKLPLNQRSVLILFYYHKMTMPEIAETLGIAENTLRKRLQAAHEKLRRILQTDAAYASANISSTAYLPAPIRYRGEKR